VYRLLKAFERAARKHERYQIHHVDPDLPDPRAQAALARLAVHVETLRDALLNLATTP
jgi:hypothetical protein